MNEPLVDLLEKRVLFHEVDMYKVVWHGHYVKFFEEGRESFAQKYDLNITHLYGENILVPIVDMKLRFRKPLRYGDAYTVETLFPWPDGAKLEFHYRIIHSKTGAVHATGSTLQVFCDTDGDVLILPPVYYRDWKERMIKRQTGSSTS